MPFFTYKQNNSGGGFDEDVAAGIGYAVCIEAESAEDADKRAQAIGIYFDGCSTGEDCPCCGDRWREAWGDGDPEPLLYGQPIKGGWGHASYIHYANGKVARVGGE